MVDTTTPVPAFRATPAHLDWIREQRIAEAEQRMAEEHLRPLVRYLFARVPKSRQLPYLVEVTRELLRAVETEHRAALATIEADIARLRSNA